VRCKEAALLYVRGGFIGCEEAVSVELDELELDLLCGLMIRIDSVLS
jgi:hypothetical protein